MHDWSRHSILSQSRVPLYEKYSTVIYALGSAHDNSGHPPLDAAEFNILCRSKSNLPNQTDSNAALLPYLTRQLGSAYEWNGVNFSSSFWNQNIIAGRTMQSTFEYR